MRCGICFRLERTSAVCPYMLYRRVGTGMRRPGVRPPYSFFFCKAMYFAIAAENRHGVQTLPTDAVQGVGDLLRLEAKLLRVVHMVQSTAAAALTVGAEAAGHPVCGWLEELCQLRLGAVAADVGDRDLADLAADRVRNEDRTAVDPADAQALGGITGDLHRCFLTDFQHNWLLLFHVKQFLCAVPSAHPVFPNYTTNAVGSPYCIFEPCVVQWRHF